MPFFPAKMPSSDPAVSWRDTLDVTFASQTYKAIVRERRRLSNKFIVKLELCEEADAMSAEVFLWFKEWCIQFKNDEGQVVSQYWIDAIREMPLRFDTATLEMEDEDGISMATVTFTISGNNLPHDRHPGYSY